MSAIGTIFIPTTSGTVGTVVKTYSKTPPTNYDYITNEQVVSSNFTHMNISTLWHHHLKSEISMT